MTMTMTLNPLITTGESSSSSEVIGSEDSSEESKSISSEISASEDEGYIGSCKG